MKFRAVINDQNCMREFFNIISTLSRMSKEICFNIQSEQILIICCDISVNGMPQIWSDINNTSYFQQYQMEGINTDKNPFILFTMSTTKLTTAIALLRAGIGVSYTKLKLTNKQFPCLTIDMEIASTETTDTRIITHDVPVKIIPIRDWPEFELPIMRKFQYTLKMPSSRSLRQLVDKMKNIAPTLTIYSHAKGEFSIVIETVSATIASHYTNLDTQKIQQNNGDDPVDKNSDSDEISCCIDTKQFANCMSSIQFQDVQMYCNVKQDSKLKMFVKIRDGVHLNYLMWSVAG